MLQTCGISLNCITWQDTNENKHGGKFVLWDLSEWGRKELRKCDFNNFYDSVHDVWAMD